MKRTTRKRNRRTSRARRKPAKRTTRKAEPRVEPESGPQFFANEVAIAFCDDLEIVDPNEREDHEFAALMIGQHLASEDRPGQWATIDVTRLYQQMPPGDHQRIGCSLCFVGMLGWLGIHHYLPRQRVLEYLEQIERNAPKSPLITGTIDSLRPYLGSRPPEALLN